ncbi:hypothetical protein [Ferrimonas sp.]|uniref:hypothetical protein n=1 Tax=Ferrimonas sp. TaxID=2080861 RepID=UPI003A9013B8
MEDEVMTLIGIQQTILDECLRALLYARKYHSLDKTDFNKTCGSCFTKTLIIQWCQIFGSRNEDIHWSKLQLPDGYPIFDRNVIVDACDLTIPEWVSYHEEMKTVRDKFIAHFDLDQLRGHIPKFEPALSVLLAYRQYLIDVIEHANANGQIILRNFLDNDALIEKIGEELAW